jgi:hypothetical protein
MAAPGSGSLAGAADVGDLLKGGGQLLLRLQSLLPQLKQSNSELDAKVAAGTNVDIENIGDGSQHVIQMDLSLGVATLPDELAPHLLNKASALCVSYDA